MNVAACSQCGSKIIRMEAFENEGWRVSCGNGHVWFPVPGTVLTFRNAFVGLEA